ncbi:MAG: DUF3179 domain-containing protein [Thermoplasmata archaeon]
MASDKETSSKASSRRTFIKLALGLGGAAFVAGLAGPPLASRLLAGGTGGGGTGTQPTGPCAEFASFQSNIRGGGPPKDGIPPIDNPQFMSAEAADDFLRPTDIVFGLDSGGVQRAYPQRILVWHEIVNDRPSGTRLAVSYCPLTGSQIAFRSPAGGDGGTFGVSGNLVNSNLLMYDRASDSNWPQILGTAINGARCASVLAEVPVVWTTWDRWRQRHPGTDVLTTETGFLRDYNRDPYGLYNPDPHGYYRNDNLIFPVMNQSDRFTAKKVVYGVKVGNEQLAIPAEEFQAIRVKNITLGGAPLVALQDEDLKVVRAFRREVEGTSLTFQHAEGQILDEESGTVWSAEGVGLEGSYQGSNLAPVPAPNVMWFAWYAFYPGTQVLS